jgi:glycerol-3-phosphate acyltransferase PlsY
VLELGLKLLIAYLLGSLMGALLVGRLRGVDIRTLGSGNAGGTNALRTQGKLFALAVVAIDVAKGWLAAAWLPGVQLPGVGSDADVARDWLVMGCALAVIVGHVFPVWYEFRGGKGAATLVGVLAAVVPDYLLPLLAIWLLVVMLTGYVGLATICACSALPVLIAVLATPPSVPLLWFAALTAAFVIFTHRSNIARMRAGTESRARRLWLLRR